MTVRPLPLSRCIHAALLCGASLLACANARAADPADAQANAPNPPATASSDAAQLGNITVTAQSRTQEVQDVPIPIQIVTTKQIESLQATDMAKLEGYIPGLSVSGEQATQPGYSLRGISISDFGIGTDSPIGIWACASRRSRPDAAPATTFSTSCPGMRTIPFWPTAWLRTNPA